MVLEAIHIDGCAISHAIRMSPAYTYADDVVAVNNVDHKRCIASLQPSI